MNFEQLMKKMKAIDEGQMADECGAMPIGISGPSEQQDNVTMNVSMNGSGAGGIRDLMAILKNIEDAEHDHGHADVLVGEPSHEEPIMGAIVQSMGHEHDMGEEYENSVDGGSEPQVYGVDAVTTTGNDLASTGGNEFPKVNGGGNPMQEALVSRLAQMYDEIKEGAKYRDPKYKDKLYTQEPRDEDDYGSDDDYYNPKPDDYPGAKNLKGGGEFDHNDPLRKGYGRHGTGSMNTHGKRKGMPSRDHISSLKGSIKAAHGTHPRPNLPE
jgi:hypothetical protein